MSNMPTALYVGSSSIEEYTSEPWEDIERDPRGLLLMWEEPDPRYKYIMGMDGSEGITGWSRATRYDGDHKTDNGAIVILRVDGAWDLQYVEENGKRIPAIDPVTKKPKRIYKDVQVAEFAAPCDAVEIARVANVLGRIYCGNAEDQCELIWEAWPGVGMLVTQELVRLNYGNLWHWEHIDDIAEETKHLGWRSSRESQKLLWYRARRHLMNRQALIRSRFLLDEYANAEIDIEKMRARAAYGYHDDRFQAANMAFWGAHKWTMDMESSHEEVTTAQVVDYQRRAPGLGDITSFREWKEEATADWWDV